MAIIFIAIGGVHSNRSQNAEKINKEYPIPLMDNSYNSCKIPDFIADPDIAQDTLMDIALKATEYCMDNEEQC